MPCNSDYMNATFHEQELSKVACLLDEIDGKTFSGSDWNGYHPAVYGKRFDSNAMVSKLCSKLQKADVSAYSLEMQIWWRDHQKADKERLQADLDEAKSQAERKKALAKLTKYEKQLLGL